MIRLKALCKMAEEAVGACFQLCDLVCVTALLVFGLGLSSTLSITTVTLRHPVMAANYIGMSAERRMA